MNSAMRGGLAVVGCFVFSAILSACEKQEAASLAPSPDLMTNPFARPKKEAASPEKRTKELAKLEAFDGIPFEIKDQCSRQLCGEPGAAISESSIRTGRGIDPKQADSLIGQDLGAVFGRIESQNAANELAIAARIESALPRLQSLEMSPPYTMVMNLIWAFSKTEDEKIAAALRRVFNQYVFDRKALIEATKDWSSEDRDAFEKMALDLYNSPEVTLLSEIKGIGARDYFLLKGKSSAQTFGGELIESIQNLQKVFPEMGIKVPGSVSLLKEKSEISAKLERDLSSAIIFKYLSKAIENKSPALMARKIPVAKIVERERAGGYLPRLRAYLSSPASSTQASREQEMQCRQKIAQMITAAPTVAEITSLKQRLARIKESAAGFAMTLNRSEEFKRYITDKINNIAFEMPMDRGQTVQFIASVFSELEEKQAEAARLAGNYGDQALILRLSQLMDQGFDSTGLESTCESLGAKAIEDRALLLLAKIQVGWATVRFPEMQGGVIGHEIGHMISLHIRSFHQSSPRLQTLDKCLGERHGVPEKTAVSSYLEEDFADQVGAFVTKDLAAKAEPAGNFGCLLMGEDGQRWGTNNGLMMKWPDSLSGVSHSPELYRAVQVALATKDRLPPSCQDMVSRYYSSAAATCAL